MTLAACLFALAVAGQTAPAAFELLDVEAVDGRPVNRYAPVELVESPVRPVTWEGPPPGGARFGLLRVGPRPDTALAVAWVPETSTLWVDADGDRRFARDERHVVKPGAPLAVPVKLGGAPARRTLLVRPGLLGAGPRYAVRGAMAGRLTLGGQPVRALLLDLNADGCFDAAGTDRVCVDLDGDGRFDPVTEQFPLGSPIPFGRTRYTVASDPWAQAVAAHERDPRVGRVRLSLGSQAPAAKLVELSANLVSETGELVTVPALGEPAEAPVGQYRVAGLTLRLAEPSGRVWSYSFGSSRGTTVAVTPGKEVQVDLLEGLTFDVTVATLGGIHPGDEIDATPHLQLASGLYLANCTTRLGDAGPEQPRSAAMVLESPDGKPLDQAVSGFA